MELLYSRLLLLFYLVLPVIYHVHNRRKERRNQRPFGVDRLEQIFRANTESRLMELFLFHFRQTGHTLEQVFLGSPVFGTVEPANMEAILSSHFKELLRPQFHVKEYSDLNMFKDATDNLLNAIPREGGVIDLQPLFFRLTLDVTTEFLFGESIESLKVPESTGEDTFAEAFNVAQEYVAKRFRLLDLYWLIDGKKFRDTCKKVHYFADKIIDRNLAEDSIEGQGKYVFLRAMSEKTPDRTVLRSQIINILTAGRDTTAFKRNLKPYTRLLLLTCSALRLYPSVPVNTRTTVRTTILPTGGGPDRKSPVLVPKGTAVAYSVYTMHRRPDLYGIDAELFRPERWDEDMPLNHDETNAKWGYLPFNGGPRICLGMDFALVEAAYTIVRIVQRFPIIKLPAGEKVELTGVEKQRITLVMSIAEGCNIELG
ncbi:cytochrome P450 alkane hydroxylase [Leptodontidium sp. MPI-SDFR-AT-0119]|nr:cytochrome P450 alkane hydroxylase [Leptodontidium sp. MPI-SDFR-AT-0119]